MNHDEALRILKQELFNRVHNPYKDTLRGNTLNNALDCAITVLEPKATQFDERITAIYAFNCVSAQDCYDGFPIARKLINDMAAHIKKLEGEK